MIDPYKPTYKIPLKVLINQYWNIGKQAAIRFQSCCGIHYVRYDIQVTCLNVVSRFDYTVLRN